VTYFNWSRFERARVGWTERSEVQQLHGHNVGVRWRSLQPTRA